MKIRKFLLDISHIIPDKVYINLKFHKIYGRFVNFKNPQTYCEKLQWLKLYNRVPIYSILVDKYLIKEYVAKLIGNEHVIKILGVWKHFDEIDFDKLPKQFVLKCNHDCGGVIICKDKLKLNIKEAKKIIEAHLKHNYFWDHREWPYKNVKPLIFAEEYIFDESGYELKDYKWFCFDGEPRVLYIAHNRQNTDEETKFDFYDMEFNHLSIRNGHPNSNFISSKPAGFDEMKMLAGTLSKGIPHVRVDFYNIKGHIYFGEMTLFHFAGFVKFEPKEWDLTFGSWIKLPDIKIK